MVENDEKAYDKSQSKYGVTPLVIDELRRTPGLFHEIFAFIKIVKIINKIKPDIVHTHHAKAGTLGRLAAKLAGVTIRVHTFHGHVLSGYFSKYVSKLVIMVERWLTKLSTAIITISNEQFSDIVNNYKIAPKEITKVIPLGFDFNKMVNIENPKGSWRKKLGISNSETCIGFIGRLAPIKNTSLLIDAFTEYLTINHDASLWIIGDGPDKLLIERKIVENNISERVKFLGWQTKLSDIYQDLDIVALTSLNEGTPVAIIESLAHGVPVVSTNVGGVKSIISLSEMGMVVDSFDKTTFANAIDETVRQHALRKGDHNPWYDIIYQKYSSERLVKDIKSLYRNLY